MKLRLRKNLMPWLRDQLSRPQWFRNFFITRNAWASFSVYSHVRRSTGTAKKTYPTKEAALKVAEKESFKKGVHFSVYKCLYCDGWHCGKNAQNKLPEPKNEKEKYLFMPKEVLRECLVKDPVLTLKKLRDTGVMPYVFPQLERTYGLVNSDGKGTVWEHILQVLSEAQRSQSLLEDSMSVILMAVLLLETQDDKAADDVMNTLKFSKNETNAVKSLICLYRDGQTWNSENGEATDRQLRKLQYECKDEAFFRLFMTLLQVEGVLTSMNAELLLERTDRMTAEGTAMFGFKGFLNSKELMEITGIKPGPQIKVYLAYLLELAFEDPHMDREQVLKELDEYKHKLQKDET